MTWVLNDENLAGAPATHVMVVGVGEYTHLPAQLGASSLSSPPKSARAFTDWLLKSFNNPELPLASVHLLLSDAAGSQYVPDGRPTIDIELATMDNLKRAFGEWKGRCDSSKDNLAIFYFCGHGIAAGTEMSLLLSDFGVNENDPLESAIDFNRFFIGMDQCLARRQAFFIDACRVSSTLLVDNAGYYGVPLVAPKKSIYGQRKAPVYYATLAGERAYALPDKESVFTEALISAMDGAGSDDALGDWCVDTDTLPRGISFLIELNTSVDERLDQANATGGIQSRFTIHHLGDKPSVPVKIECTPSAATEDAKLGYRNATVSEEREQPTSVPWIVKIEEGNYEFSADFPNGNYQPGRLPDKYIRPPYRPVKIEVAR